MATKKNENTTPRRFCPECGEDLSPPGSWNSVAEWEETPHADVKSCLRYLKSRVEEAFEEINSLSRRLNDYPHQE